MDPFDNLAESCGFLALVNWPWPWLTVVKIKQKEYMLIVVHG